MNDRFIGTPLIHDFIVGWADSGIINQQSYSPECGPMECDNYGCIDRACFPGPHMICDLNGNGIQWSQLRNNTMVKIRTMFRHWPGYEYLYASKDGRYFVIILQILR